MANPFGSNDEALSKNTNHANQANLIHAVIPRSAEKFVEVISASSITGLTGVYDADGFWHPNTTTRTDVQFTISTPWPVGNNHTVIAGWYRNTGAGAPTSAPNAGALKFGGTPLTISTLTSDGTQLSAFARDNSSQQGPGSYVSMSANGAFAVCHKNNTTGPVQSGYRRVGSTNTPLTDTALTLGTTSSHNVDRVGIKTASRYPFLYLFIYDAALSDEDINAIIVTPGDVLSYTAGGGKPANYFSQL